MQDGVQQFNFAGKGVPDFSGFNLVVGQRLFHAFHEFQIFLEDVFLFLAVFVHGVRHRVPDIAPEYAVWIAAVHRIYPVLDTAQDGSGAQQPSLGLFPLGHGPFVAGFFFLLAELGDTGSEMFHDFFSFYQLAIHHHLLGAG